jgi:peptide/nickel transport system permease protein
MVGTLLGAVVGVRLLLWSAPGDPIDMIPNGEDMRAELEAAWGLDQGLGQQLLMSIRGALGGDLGESLVVRPGSSVLELMGRAVTDSLALLLPATLLSLMVALGLALWTSGRRPLSRFLIEAVSVMPVFLLAYMLVMGLNSWAWEGIQSGAMARPAWFALPDQGSALRQALAICVLASGSGLLASLHAAIEDELVDLQNRDHIFATLARGGSPLPSIARNMVVPVLNVLAARTAWLVGGLVIVEKMFLMSGMGALFWEASLRRDAPLAMGLALAAATLVCGVRFARDGVAVWLDPRRRSLP